MTNANAKAFEDKLLTIDLVDGLRREQERLDAALNDGERMKALRTEIQAYYAQAGITVSEALIDQAIAERQAQRFAFKPSKLSALGRAIANCYVYRGRIAAGVGALAAITVFAWFLDQQITDWQQERALSAYREQLQGKLDDLRDAQQARADLPARLKALQSEHIPALPNWQSELDLAYQQTMMALTELSACNDLSLPAELQLSWPKQGQLDACHASLPKVTDANNRAEKLFAAHRELEQAVAIYGLLQQRLDATPSLNEWTAIVTAVDAAMTHTIVGSDRQQFTQAVASASMAMDTIAAVAGAHARASRCLTDATKLSVDNDHTVLSGLLNEGLAFKQSPSVDGVAAWAERAETTCGFFKTPVTLRVVSERGEKTGVWRYYDGNRGAKTYYIIVDALSGGGNNATALIQSAEDQKSYERRRFGVRVNEATFEAVKRDKQDDGLLERPDVGQKPANSLRWQMVDGFEPTFIAEW